MALARVRAWESTAKRSLTVYPLGAAFVDHALGVHHQEIFLFDAERDVKGGAGDPGGRSFQKTNFHVLDFLPATSRALTRAAPEMAAPISSWKTGMSQLFSRRSSYLEALRRSNVLEAHAAECWRESL